MFSQELKYSCRSVEEGSREMTLLYVLSIERNANKNSKSVMKIKEEKRMRLGASSTNDESRREGMG